MNIALWVLQTMIALHTAMGAVWKISHSEQAVPSLRAIPHGVWSALIPFELLCAAALLVPLVYRRLAIAAPIGALAIGIEMLVFSGVHVGSDVTKHAELVYWLVVAAFCAFIAYGRFALIPIAR